MVQRRLKASRNWMKRFVPTQRLRVQKGREFSIVLESNPASGFSWQPLFDDSFIHIILRFRTSSLIILGQHIHRFEVTL